MAELAAEAGVAEVGKAGATREVEVGEVGEVVVVGEQAAGQPRQPLHAPVQTSLAPAESHWLLVRRNTPRGLLQCKEAGQGYRRGVRDR